MQLSGGPDTDARTSDLPLRLRQDTADLHAEVERVVGLPGSVTSRTSYGDLLQRLYNVHAPAERELRRWMPEFTALGLDVAARPRSSRIVADLALLGRSTAATVSAPRAPEFAGALGCLYVLEGSALGGRLIAPVITARLGDVPTGFLDAGAAEPGRWQRVLRALRTLPPGDHPQVVRGAEQTFAAFLAAFDGHRPYPATVS